MADPACGAACVTWTTGPLAPDFNSSALAAEATILSSTAAGAALDAVRARTTEPTTAPEPPAKDDLTDVAAEATL